jgi:hypothetical protein
MIREAIRTVRLPALPRDLRLPATTAARLRPAGWRRLIRAIGTSRDAVTRPLALSLTGLGLAGLLLTVLPPVTLPSGAAGTTTGGTTATDVQAPAGGHVGIAGEPAVSPTQQVDREIAVTSMADASDSQLLVLSASMLASGGTLLVVRRLATRSRAVP